MQSPDRFIVRPIKGKRYNNTKDIGGLEFITSTSEEVFLRMIYSLLKTNSSICIKRMASGKLMEGIVL